MTKMQKLTKFVEDTQQAAALERLQLQRQGNAGGERMAHGKNVALILVLEYIAKLNAKKEETKQ